MSAWPAWPAHISTDLLRVADTRLRGWITGYGSKWITRLIYSLSEISKKSILAAEKSLIFCHESDGEDPDTALTRLHQSVFALFPKMTFSFWLS